MSKQVKLAIALVALLAVVLAVIPCLAATTPAPPPPRPRAAGPGPGGAGFGPGADMAQFMDAMLDRLGLSATEKPAVKAALQAKLKARQELSDHLQAFREQVRAQNLSADVARKALDSYRRYQRDYEQQVAGIDQGLSRKLSPVSQARLVAAGVIDNGLGMGGMRRGGAGDGRGGRPGMGFGGQPAQPR